MMVNSVARHLVINMMKLIMTVVSIQERVNRVVQHGMEVMDDTIKMEIVAGLGTMMKVQMYVPIGKDLGL